MWGRVHAGGCLAQGLLRQSLASLSPHPAQSFLHMELFGRHFPHLIGKTKVQTGKATCLKVRSEGCAGQRPLPPQFPVLTWARVF